MSVSSKERTPRGRRLPLARAGLLALALAAVAAVGVLAAGCGGSSGEGVADVDTTETTTTTGSNSQSDSSEPNPTAYAACMRKNGVPKFPDPDANGRFQLQGGPGSGLDPSSPKFKAAEKKCQRFMPRGGEDTLDPEEQARLLRDALEHAACMREHGVPNYPDPKTNAEGGLELSMDGTTGVDPSSPQFRAAEEACKELAPGADGGDVKQSPAPGSNSGGGARP